MSGQIRLDDPVVVYGRWIGIARRFRTHDVLVRLDRGAETWVPWQHVRLAASK